VNLVLPAQRMGFGFISACGAGFWLTFLPAAPWNCLVVFGFLAFP
jgi:hypothetical protein